MVEMEPPLIRKRLAKASFAGCANAAAVVRTNRRERRERILI